MAPLQPPHRQLHPGDFDAAQPVVDFGQHSPELTLLVWLKGIDGSSARPNLSSSAAGKQRSGWDASRGNDIRRTHRPGPWGGPGFCVRRPSPWRTHEARLCNKNKRGREAATEPGAPNPQQVSCGNGAPGPRQKQQQQHIPTYGLKLTLAPNDEHGWQST